MRHRIALCFDGIAVITTPNVFTEVDMAHSSFKVLDSDIHIIEPPDLWPRYILYEFCQENSERFGVQPDRAVPITRGGRPRQGSEVCDGNL